MNEIFIIFGLSLSGISNMESDRIIPSASVELVLPDRDGEYFVGLSNTTEAYVSVGLRSGRKVKLGFEVMIFEDRFGLAGSARLNRKISPSIKVGFTKTYFLAQAGVNMCLCFQDNE